MATTWNGHGQSHTQRRRSVNSPDLALSGNQRVVSRQLRAANPRRSPARAGGLKCWLARVRGPPAGEPRSQPAQPCNQPGNQPARHVPGALAYLIAPKRGRVRQNAITLPLGVLSADGLKCEGITVIQFVQAPVSPYVRA